MRAIYSLPYESLWSIPLHPRYLQNIIIISLYYYIQNEKYLLSNFMQIKLLFLHIGFLIKILQINTKKEQISTNF